MPTSKERYDALSPEQRREIDKQWFSPEADEEFLEKHSTRRKLKRAAREHLPAAVVPVADFLADQVPESQADAAPAPPILRSFFASKVTGKTDPQKAAELLNKARPQAPVKPTGSAAIDTEVPITKPFRPIMQQTQEAKAAELVEDVASAATKPSIRDVAMPPAKPAPQKKLRSQMTKEERTAAAHDELAEYYRPKTAEERRAIEAAAPKTDYRKNR